MKGQTPRVKQITALKVSGVYGHGVIPDDAGASKVLGIGHDPVNLVLPDGGYHIHRDPSHKMSAVSRKLGAIGD
ncbi:hypothetical protein JCM15640A_22150 [Hoylesella timonensis 4401737 = DSM 22865 = JCM 15640]